MLDVAHSNKPIDNGEVISIRLGDRLNCTTNTSLPTDITWFLDAQIVGSGNNALLYTATVPGSHTLTCMAINSGSTSLCPVQSSTITVTVVGKYRL
jgi:hypothetical protein